MTTLLLDEKVNPFGFQAGLVGARMLLFTFVQVGLPRAAMIQKIEGAVRGRLLISFSFLPRELSFVMTT